MTELEQAVEALRRGGVVAFPTETFYGLAADALNPSAVERLVALKGRPGGKAIPCIVGDRAQLPRLCASFPALAERIAERFWPGPVTVVVPGRPDLPAPLRPEGTVGVRLSSHPLARALANGLGGPITSTSANPAGGREAVEAGEVDAGLGLDFVLDGGRCAGGKGSTVVAVEPPGLRCLRDGAVPFADLLRALGLA